jgi:hypothetical protein
VPVGKLKNLLKKQGYVIEAEVCGDKKIAY